MTIKADYGVFIGKFAPFHNGHLKNVIEGLKHVDYLILVVGSDNISLNTMIPFTALQRSEIILAGLPQEIRNRVLITTARDYKYNDAKWIGGIQSAVNQTIELHKGRSNPSYTNRGFKDYNNTIALVGMKKDETSYYLNIFPQWRTEVGTTPEMYEDEMISSTTIRKKIFFNEIGYCANMMPKGSYERMIHTIESNPEDWKRLQSDFDYENKYEALWGKGPHVTVDACVVQAGHILLIKRGREYGFGKLALPGGFLNRREKIEDGVIRELREETRVKVPEKVLRGSIKERKVFDDPYRSNRSHLITHAFLIELENVSTGLPKVIGSDDAMEAMWIPISSIVEYRYEFFEDHYFIIADLLNL